MVIGYFVSWLICLELVSDSLPALIVCIAHFQRSADSDVSINLRVEVD